METHHQGMASYTGPPPDPQRTDIFKLGKTLTFVFCVDSMCRHSIKISRLCQPLGSPALTGVGEHLPSFLITTNSPGDSAITVLNPAALAAVRTAPGRRGYDRRRRRPSRRTTTSGAIALIVSCSAARLSWIEAITGPIGTPTSTSTASDSWRLASIVSGTASEAPMR